MKASVVDLRYRMNDVLKALERNENVTVYHRGKVKGVIVPKTESKLMKVEEHPFFGSNKNPEETVEDIMAALRATRYRDL